MSNFNNRKKRTKLNDSSLENLSSNLSKKPNKKMKFGKKKNLEDALPKLKKQRKRKMYRRLIPLVVLFLFGIGVTSYFISPLSKLGEVSIDNNINVTDQEVIQASSLKAHQSLWKIYFSKTDIEKKIVKAIPQVKHSKIELKNINNLNVKIDEFETVGYLHQGKEYYTILEDGKIVNESRTVSFGNAPVFKNFEEGKALNLLVRQYSSLTDPVQNAISEIEATPSKSDPYLVLLYMNDGNQVVASIPSLADKMNYYPEMIRKIGERKGIINVEVGGYFTPFKNERSDETLDEEINKNFQLEENDNLNN